MNNLCLMRKRLPILVAFLLSANVAHAQEQELDLLTGDTRLACEAVLCLSSGVRPGECRPALDRYFGIRDKRPHRMIQKRIDFLNQCPVANEPNMPSLIQAIAHGAGRCDADFLNTYNTFTYRETICTRDGFGDSTCRTITKTAISNELPKYCGIYQNHEWTYEVGVKYVGTPKLGGKWVKSSDYEREKTTFDRKVEELRKTRSGRAILESTTQTNQVPKFKSFGFGGDR